MHNYIQVSFNGWLVPSVNDLISRDTIKCRMSNAHRGDYYAVVLMVTAGTDHGLLKLHGLWDGPCKTFSRIQFLSVLRLTYISRLLYRSSK